VQEQEARRGRHGARDLEPPLAPVREVPRLLVGQSIEMKDLQELPALSIDARFLPGMRRAAEDRAAERRLLPAVEGHLHVFDHGHVSEKAYVLESTGDSLAGDPPRSLAGDVLRIETHL